MKSKRQDIREQKQDFKKNTNLQGAEKREGVKEYRSSMKTNREATREARQGKLMAAGDEKWQEGDDSRLKYFTPDYEKSTSKKVKGAMFGYVEAGKQERSRMNQLQNEEKAKIYSYSKSAEDNATNRNSTSERMKKFWRY